MGFFAFSGAAVAVPAPVHAPAAPVPPTYSVTLTGYNAVPAQTDGSPFMTASGAFSDPQVVAARSRDLAKELPFGTIIAIEGPATAGHGCGYNVVGKTIGYRIIADTMNAKFTDRIDALFPTAASRARNRAVVLGVCRQVTIRVVGHINLSHPATMPKTQRALVTLITGAGKGDLALK